MPNYKFKVHDQAGAEKLGAAVLADDDEALAFAKRVMAELLHRDAICTPPGEWKSPPATAAW
jgi:hypothetical protein